MTQRVDSASDRSVYRQIADNLRMDIERGRFGAGEQLPSESQLMKEYGVSRVTVRRALNGLVTSGLVLAQHGRGWFVRRRPPARRLDSDRFVRRHAAASRAGAHPGPGAGAEGGFVVELGAGGRPFRVEVLQVGLGPVPGEHAGRLGIDAGAEVVVRRQRHLAGEQPVEIASSYIPVEIAAGTPIGEPDAGPGGVYARMEEQGLVFERYDEELVARMPTEEESGQLRLPPASPVLHLIRTAVASGQVVEVCDTVLDASAFVLHYQLPA